MLTGPAITDGTQVATATALPPDVGSGQTQWTIAITFKAFGKAAWSAYTVAHNTGGTGAPDNPVTSCGRAGTPCADYVAFIADGAVVSLPANVAAITGDVTRISGNFTQDSATALAAQISSDQLAAPLHTTSVQVVNLGR